MQGAAAAVATTDTAAHREVSRFERETTPRPRPSLL